MPKFGSDPFDKELHFFDREVLHRDLAWYADQFKPAEGKEPTPVRGEVTPAYSILSRAVVREIGRLMPDLRLVFIIRNPIDRIWSQISMRLSDWKRKEPAPIPSFSELVKMAEHPRVVLRTDYRRTISNWTDVFGREALLVLTFEEHIQGPVSSLPAVLRHIGADPVWKPTPLPDRSRVWPAPGINCPSFLRFYLANRWLPETRRLNRELEGRIQSWVTSLEEASKPAKSYWLLQSRNYRLIARATKFREERKLQRSQHALAKSISVLF